MDTMAPSSAESFLDYQGLVAVVVAFFAAAVGWFSSRGVCAQR